MIVSAPAKIILTGEHAVVYGQPAIALPVTSLRARVEVEPSTDGFKLIAHDLQQTIQYMRHIQENDALVSPLQRVITLTLDAIGKPLPEVSMHLRSDIPIASGLGSGAAIAAAVSRGIAAAVGVTLDNHELNQIVFEAEKFHHGTPSGVDNTVVVYERPVYFVRGNPIESVSIGAPFYIIIADTGQPSPTRLSVADVRELVEKDPLRYRVIIERIGSITVKARRMIELGDLAGLGDLLNQNHDCLRDLTVSSDELDHLVAAAHKAGAFGAKLSGGGRGGNMIALTTHKRAAEIAEALRTAGAVRVIITEIRQ